jgi:hydrogenase maturation protease
MTGRTVVAGMGSEFRRDDGVGPVVAARVAHRIGGVCDMGPVAEPLDLLGRWDRAALAVVVDAVRSGATPGSVAVVDLSEVGGARTSGASPSSTHGLDLADVLRLARAVDQAPDRVVVVTIKGADFGQGWGLSPAVADAVPEAVETVVKLLGRS